MSGVEIRELPGYDGKYWLDNRGRVWRRDDAGELYKCAQNGAPPRVRLYRNGKESRLYVYKLFETVWPDRPDLAQEKQ